MDGELRFATQDHPLAFARARPSPVLVRISSRSNSASPPNTVSIKRPWAVVVSAQVSLSDLKPFLGDRSQQVQEIARGSRQAIEPGDDQYVALREYRHQAHQLLAIGPSTADFLLKYLDRISRL
jgi:hypothetical protein